MAAAKGKVVAFNATLSKLISIPKASDFSAFGLVFFALSNQKIQAIVSIFCV
jgi:hypothetical protein